MVEESKKKQNESLVRIRPKDSLKAGKAGSMSMFLMVVYICCLSDSNYESTPKINKNDVKIGDSQLLTSENRKEQYKNTKSGSFIQLDEGYDIAELNDSSSQLSQMSKSESHNHNQHHSYSYSHRDSEEHQKYDNEHNSDPYLRHKSNKSTNILVYKSKK